MPRRRPAVPFAPPSTIGLVMVLGLGLVAGPMATAASGQASAGQRTPGPPVLGVDVSHYSGSIDWQQVESAGYVFAYIKASEGVDSPDPAFAEAWQAVDRTSLRRGAYHFFVTEDPAADQAKLFFQTVGELTDDDLVPVVDVEVIGRETREGWVSELRTFLGLLESRYGAKPMLYTSPNFWEAHLDDTFGDHPLWIADYGVDAPELPAGWDRWTVWQFAENRSVPGIEKDVDPNRLAKGVPVDSLTLGARRTGTPATSSNEDQTP